MAGRRGQGPIRSWNQPNVTPLPGIHRSQVFRIGKACRFLGLEKVCTHVIKQLIFCMRIVSALKFGRVSSQFQGRIRHKKSC